MIEGGLPYVYAAYAVAALLLGALTLTIALRARHWAKEARELDQRP
jgi:heme exporter protein CcmD